jgi:tetratricopeptide (TPR) repeat protein
MTDPDRASRHLLLELDPEKIDENLREAGRWVKEQVGTHRWTKVRLNYKGKQMGPDIPLGLFLAGEIWSLSWAGPLRLILMNLGLGSVLDVELINEADERVAEGRALFNDGEVEAAEAKYREALRMRVGEPEALLALGVLLRVTGRKEEARDALSQAAADPEHPAAEKARVILDRMGGGTLIP